MHVTAAEELAALLLDELTASVSSFSANASIDELGQRATTSATLNIPEAEGSSGTNLKNQHFMKKVLSSGIMSDVRQLLPLLCTSRQSRLE